MNLSPHFTLEEFINSDFAIRQGIDNTPSEEVKENLQALCENVLEPLRDIIGSFQITSGYRCLKLNNGIGGAKTSQHIEGKASDNKSTRHTTEELFQICKAQLKYDQVIQEFDSWVHISWNGSKNRQQALRATKVKGKTIYSPA